MKHKLMILFIRIIIHINRIIKVSFTNFIKNKIINHYKVIHKIFIIIIIKYQIIYNILEINKFNIFETNDNQNESLYRE